MLYTKSSGRAARMVAGPGFLTSIKALWYLHSSRCEPVAVSRGQWFCGQITLYPGGCLAVEYQGSCGVGILHVGSGG